MSTLPFFVHCSLLYSHRRQKEKETPDERNKERNEGSKAKKGGLLKSWEINK
jgi:hypothetical protein